MVAACAPLALVWTTSLSTISFGFQYLLDTCTAVLNPAELLCGSESCRINVSEHHFDVRDFLQDGVGVGGREQTRHRGRQFGPRRPWIPTIRSRVVSRLSPRVCDKRQEDTKAERCSLLLRGATSHRLYLRQIRFFASRRAGKPPSRGTLRRASRRGSGSATL